MKPAFYLQIQFGTSMTTMDELKAAIAAADYAKTKCLLEMNANPNEFGDRGETIMHFVSSQDWLCPNTLFKFERLLLEHGADPNIVSKSGYVPLILVLKDHKYCLFRYCTCNWELGNEDKCPPRKREESETDARPEAERYRRVIFMCSNKVEKFNAILYQITELFLQHGADPNFETMIGYTPIYFTDVPDIIRLLIKYGADPNHQDDWGNTSLSTVLSVEAARCLLENGADPEIRNYKNETAYECQLAKNRDEHPAIAALIKSFLDEKENAMLIKPAR